MVLLRANTFEAGAPTSNPKVFIEAGTDDAQEDGQGEYTDAAEQKTTRRSGGRPKKQCRWNFSRSAPEAVNAAIAKPMQWRPRRVSNIPGDQPPPIVLPTKAMERTHRPIAVAVSKTHPPTHGLHWRQLGTIAQLPEAVIAMEGLLSPSAWADSSRRFRSTDVLRNTQLVMKSHGGSRRGELACQQTCHLGSILTETVKLQFGATLCSACQHPLVKHVDGEVFMNRMERGQRVNFHTDDRPPASTGSCCESTVVLLLNAANKGGVLRVSSLASGTAKCGDRAGGHVARDTDELPLKLSGDAVWIDGEFAEHRVDKVQSGTRVTLLLGCMCPTTFQREPKDKAPL
jgi:hypothetical protein